VWRAAAPDNQKYSKKGNAMNRRADTVRSTREIARKFVRYREGAEKYGMGLSKFQALAREAKAVYKVDKIVLVNCEIFEQFLETFREY